MDQAGLVTYYVLFFLHIATRRVHIAGVTRYPDECWMAQMARNVTMVDVGFLSRGQYLIHDRDSKFSAQFDAVLKAAGIRPITLPAKSPNLNPHAERWVQSVQTECLSKLILFGEGSLRHALASFVDHYHGERNHRGKGNKILFPSSHISAPSTGPLRCRERLGGLLKYYYRDTG